MIRTLSFKLIILCILLSLIIFFTWPREIILSRSIKKYAYVQYATNRQYLCNSLINVVRLRNLNVDADLVILLPEKYITSPAGRPIARLVEGLLTHGVKLLPLDMSHYSSHDITYADSFQKLEIFKLNYERVIYFDSDGLIALSMDHLFSAPESDLLLPEAYYVSPQNGSRVLSSALMVIRPGEEIYNYTQSLVAQKAETDFDMEIINKLARSPKYARTTGILPWRRYLVLSGLFRDPSRMVTEDIENIPRLDEILTSHDTRNGEWDARTLFDDAYYFHFSDWPIPKPWLGDPAGMIQIHGPKCRNQSAPGAADGNCEEVKCWRTLYSSFRDEMRDLCPPPQESE